MEVLKIKGMSCGHCVAHVTRALEALPHVDKVQVDLESATAQIEGRELSRLVLKQAIEAAGYTVED